MTKRFRMFAALWVVVLVAAACGDDGGAGDPGETTSGPAVVDAIGETEGELNLSSRQWFWQLEKLVLRDGAPSD